MQKSPFYACFEYRFILHSLIRIQPMPTLKMKTKSVTSCVREASGLHICRKSSKISKNSSSLSQITHETAELATLLQNCTNGSSKVETSCREVGTNETAGHQALNKGGSVRKGFGCAEDTGSAERMECISSTCASNLETIFSPITESAIYCELSAQDDAGSVDASIMLQASADHCYDGSSGSYPYQTFDLSDFLISSKGFSGIYFNGVSGFDDAMKNNLLPDFDLADSNIIFDMTENSMILPSLEETTETEHSQHSRSNEELLENADRSWFHQVSHQIKPCDQEHDDNLGNNDLEEAECFDPYLFLRNLPDLSDGGNTFLSALLPEETKKKKHVTLVLDLDETLVHSTLEPCHNADFTFQVSFNMKEHTVYVRQRPFLGTFLERVAEMFEIIIFTASQSIYAEQLLDKLDPDKKFFSRRAYRDSCIFSDGNCTKDLTVLGVDLAKVAIVDNSPQVFRLQVDNGIPIKSWFDDPSDRALVTLLPFLEILVDVDDVRPIIAKKYSGKE